MMGWVQYLSAFLINFLELKAALFGLKSLSAKCNNVHVRIRLDNTAVAAYVNNMGGSRSTMWNLQTLDIWNWAISKKKMV